jgi:hypothetical protein
VLAQINLGEQTQDLLNVIPEGFRQSTFGIILFIFLIVLIVVVPVVIAVIIAGRARQQRIGAARRQFHQILNNRDLTDDEQNLMTRLESFFELDKQRLADLARDYTVFNTSAQKMLAAGLITDKQIARLRVKLKLIQRTTLDTLHSSVELAVGTKVFLSLKGRAGRTGSVIRLQKDGFSVTTDLRGSAGEAVVVEVHLGTGNFLIWTHIKAVEADSLLLSHSERVERIQKRRFFRKNVRLPIAIDRINAAEPVESYLLDLSGGGARFHNPHLSLRIGELISLIFFVEQAERLEIKARIKHISAKDSTVSVVFESLSERAREKIIQLVQQ